MKVGKEKGGMAEFSRVKGMTPIQSSMLAAVQIGAWCGELEKYFGFNVSNKQVGEMRVHSRSHRDPKLLLVDLHGRHKAEGEDKLCQPEEG